MAVRRASLASEMDLRSSAESLVLVVVSSLSGLLQSRQRLA